MGHWALVICSALSVVEGLLVIGYWLLVIGYWLLVIGYLPDTLTHFDYAQCPMPNSPCPIPHALFGQCPVWPMPCLANAQYYLLPPAPNSAIISST